MSRARSMLRTLKELFWRILDWWPYISFVLFIIVCLIIWVLGHPAEAMLWLWGALKYSLTP